MKSRVSSTVTKLKPNPRPRKYASASERQAAYRARAPEVCFRAEQKTVETLDRIADTIGRSRAEMLLSMTKFALANHDWARFGLTHKPLPFEYGVNPLKTEILERAKLPNGTLVRLQKRGKAYDVITNSTGITWRYLEKAVSEERARNAFDLYTMQRKENPMKTTRAKRKPTPAQLAARERFAEMARSGAFKKAGGRKANPAKKTHVWRITVFDDDGKPAKVTTDSTEQGALLYAKSKADANLSGEIHYILPKSERLEFWFDGTGIHPAGSYGNRPIYTTRRAALKTNPARKAAGVRGNPAAKKNGPFYFALVPDDGGFAYGMDERTPVQFIFTNRDRTRGIYRSFALPFSVTGNPAFQAWAASLPGNAVFASLKELRETLRAYT